MILIIRTSSLETLKGGQRFAALLYSNATLFDHTVDLSVNCLNIVGKIILQIISTDFIRHIWCHTKIFQWTTVCTLSDGPGITESIEAMAIGEK
jgi:hypothetical protein